MRIYISGPITGTDDFAERFADAAEIIAERGHEYFNPAKLAEVMPGAEWIDCLTIDGMLLKKADAITMLPGWERSSGALYEFFWARANGLKLYDLDTDTFMP